MISKIVNKTSKKFYLKYVLGLLLCKTRKTCTQMGQATELGHDALWRALKQISENGGIQVGLIEAALSLLNRKYKWWFILDDTMILKPHARKLRQAVLDRCGATGKLEKGLVAIFLSITDGKIVIPIGYKFWISRKQITNPEDYKKKWELGLELILESSDKINCKSLLMDGAYANRFSLTILSQWGFEYEARFRKNGALIINGTKQSVSQTLDPWLIGPLLYKTTRAIWQNLDVFITAHKHRNVSGDFITYTISNREVTAIQHAQDYRLRWVIEMFFRTAKQSLGIQHCASSAIAMQRAHIDACLLAFTFLQYQRLCRKYHSVEQALLFFRTAYFQNIHTAFTPADRLNHAFA
jgi:SRSO17 transposase